MSIRPLSVWSFFFFFFGFSEQSYRRYVDMAVNSSFRFDYAAINLQSNWMPQNVFRTDERFRSFLYLTIKQNLYSLFLMEFETLLIVSPSHGLSANPLNCNQRWLIMPKIIPFANRLFLCSITGIFRFDFISFFERFRWITSKSAWKLHLATTSGPMR